MVARRCYSCACVFVYVVVMAVKVYLVCGIVVVTHGIGVVGVFRVVVLIRAIVLVLLK